MNGSFTSWSDFSACSASCGDGTKFRTRTCTQPESAHGGLDCDGDTTETESCKVKECPIDGGFSDWGPYGKCSASCGGGLKHRERTCTNPKPQHGGANCASEKEVEAQVCNSQPCPGTCLNSTIYVKFMRFFIRFYPSDPLFHITLPRLGLLRVSWQ